MSAHIVSMIPNENQDNDSFMAEDSSKGGISCVDDCNVATSTAPKSNSSLALVDSKKRINEAVLSTDEMERLQTKRAYNRECASRARQRGKELISQLEKQVKDLHDDKSELRRTVAIMEKRLKHLQRENELLLGTQAIATYDGVTAGRMIENGAMQFPQQAPFPFTQGLRSTNFNSATMTLNGSPYMDRNPFY